MNFKLPLIAAFAILLSACAGTVTRDTPQNASKFAGATFSSVQLNMTDAAKKLQADNSQFNSSELKLFIERKLDAASLINPSANYQVNVTIESFRVRSAIAAVMLGIMAGTDSITGRVYVMQNGRSIHSFVVDASYGLGGIMGGDSTRMNWLYDKFAELTVKELAGETQRNDLVRKSPGAPIAPAPLAVQPANTTVPIKTQRALPEPSGFADIYDLTKFPAKSEGCKKAYSEWLEKPSPKAFAISSTGRCFYSWGTNPSDKTLPSDPTERTLHNCNLTTNNLNNCKHYAIDGVVVWMP
jgi:hypothetical protein